MILSKLITSNFCAYYQNVRGIKSKLTKLYVDSHTDVLMFTETWLNESINGYEILCSDYKIFRCDRSKFTSNKKEGGGV